MLVSGYVNASTHRGQRYWIDTLELKLGSCELCDMGAVNQT